MADMKAELKDILSARKTYCLTTNVEDYFDNIYIDDQFRTVGLVSLNWRKYGPRDITEYLESEIAIDVVDVEGDVIYTIFGDEIERIDISDNGFRIDSYESRTFEFHEQYVN